MNDVTPRTGRSAKVIAAAVVVGLIGSGALVWQASSAAFTASTENNGNTWTSGKVVLSDNDSDVALFNSTNLVPGSATNCILVTYDGTVQSDVKLYSNTPTGTLGAYLDLDISEGAGTDCTTPGALTRIFGDANTVPDNSADTLANFASAKTDFAQSVGNWAPSAAASKKPYVFTYTLASDNNAQNKSATLNFVWEAQNR